MKKKLLSKLTVLARRRSEDAFFFLSADLYKEESAGRMRTLSSEIGKGERIRGREKRSPSSLKSWPPSLCYQLKKNPLLEEEASITSTLDLGSEMLTGRANYRLPCQPAYIHCSIISLLSFTWENYAALITAKFNDCARPCHSLRSCISVPRSSVRIKRSSPLQLVAYKISAPSPRPPYLSVGPQLRNSPRVLFAVALLDRGWIRSGCFLYKPDTEKTCCPSYTIRLKASDFVPSKEQVRVSRRMERFLDGTLHAKEKDKLTDELNNQDAKASAMDSSVVGCKGMDKAEEITHFLSDKIDDTVQLWVESGKFSSDIQLPKASIKKVTPAKRKLQTEMSEALLFSCNIAFQIAATLKRSKKDGLGGNKDSIELSPKRIAEFLTSLSQQLVESCGLSVRACNGHINFYSALKQTDSVKVGKGSGNDRHLKRSSEGHQGQRRRFEIRLKRSSFDDEEYSLYKKYQIKVHNDTPDHVSESSYKRFLVDTPLLHVPPKSDYAVPPCGFGSFHQQYVVDGKLIAVGVIDILPKCLSSKYLFWDPDFAFLSLGKYSALQEIRWVSENQLFCPSLQFYYLGYYIHSCSKMRYKASYRPSELLCPLRFQWVPYDIAKSLLDRRKYVVLSDYDTTLHNGESLPLDVIDSQTDGQQNEFVEESSNDAIVNGDEMELDSDCSDYESDPEATSDATIVASENASLRNILIGVRGARLRYKDLCHAFDPSQRKFIESQLQRYARAVGTELSEQMVYSL